MKIPKQVKIGGMVYDISTPEHLAIGPGYSGEIDWERLTISVRPAARRKMEADFMHEIVHAIWDNLGYHEHDEKHIEELARAFYALIQDNPEVFTPDTPATEDAGTPAV
jgi:hypothetical protein